MRILFSFVAGNGHFQPLVPIARATQSAGHIIAFACHVGMAPTVERAGFATISYGIPSDRAEALKPLHVFSREEIERKIAERFMGEVAPDKASHLIEVARDWRPNLIVCDDMDFGSVIAAEVLNIPYATVVVLAAGATLRAAFLGDAWSAARAVHDLPPDPSLAAFHRYLTIAPVAPSFRDPAYPIPPTLHAVRPFDAPSKEAPPVTLDRSIPTVYFTLGTVFNTESGDLFGRILEGLSRLDVNVIVTVGGNRDPAVFGEQPAHVLIKRYIPQRDLLPYCDLVVSHGGADTTIAALAHGIPLIATPLGAD
ncbi:MAG: glycosyltransferase [Chloroflexota bacterium]